MTHETLKESWLEVLTAFLRLGLTSFGGPVAHLGYFRGLPLRFRRDLLQDGLPHLLIGLDEGHDLGR
jgi:chromate transporter